MILDGSLSWSFPEKVAVAFVGVVTISFLDLCLVFEFFFFFACIGVVVVVVCNHNYYYFLLILLLLLPCFSYFELLILHEFILL